MGCGSSSGMNSARVQPAMYVPSTAPSFPNRGKAGARDGQVDITKPAGHDAAGAVQGAGTRSLAHNGAPGYKSTSILSTSSTGLHSDSQRRRSVSRHQNGRGGSLEVDAAAAAVPLPGETESQRPTTQDPNRLSPNPTARSKKSKFQRPKALIDTSKAQAKAGRNVVTTVPEQEHRPLVRKSSDSTNLEHKSLQDYMDEQRKQAELYSVRGSPLRIDPSTPAMLGRGSSRFSLAGTTTASSIPSTPMTPLSNMTQPSPGAGGSVLEFMRERRIRSASLWKHRQESPAPGKNRLNAAAPNG